MTEQAEGFWWVRWRTTPWQVVLVREGGYLDWCGDQIVGEDDGSIEWGPYLGKEPGDPSAKDTTGEWLEAHGICSLCRTPGLPCHCWNDE